MILHRDLKLENVLLTEAPRARERLIYPPPPKAAEAAASAGAAGSSKEKSETAAAADAKDKASARPRPEAKLADFGLAVSFVSPDIDTRRSTLPVTSVSGRAVDCAGMGVSAGSESRPPAAPPCSSACASAAPSR